MQAGWIRQAIRTTVTFASVSYFKNNTLRSFFFFPFFLKHWQNATTFKNLCSSKKQSHKILAILTCLTYLHFSADLSCKWHTVSVTQPAILFLFPLLTVICKYEQCVCFWQNLMNGQIWMSISNCRVALYSDLACVSTVKLVSIKKRKTEISAAFFSAQFKRHVYLKLGLACQPIIQWANKKT